MLICCKNELAYRQDLQTTVRFDRKNTLLSLHFAALMYCLLFLQIYPTTSSRSFDNEGLLISGHLTRCQLMQLGIH